MTPSAARGVLEAIHWKPAIRWIIDAIHVLNPIRFQSIRRNEVGRKAPDSKIRQALAQNSLRGLAVDAMRDRQQRSASVLVKVNYFIEAHFGVSDKAGPGETVGKHLDMFNRRAAGGQCFHQPSLGMREFPAAFELLPPGAPLPEPRLRSPELGFGAPRSLGLMLFDIDYESEQRPPLLFSACLDEGVMRVPHPSSPEIRR